MLTPEQAEAIKSQLIENVEKNFPEDKSEFAISQIESMDSEGLEEFLNKNNLDVSGNSQCIFCSIVSGKINSHKIAEIPEALAVLEINPVSKGHVIIIPREHTLDYSNEPEGKIKEFIKTISGRIEKALQPKGIAIENSSLFGHQIINIIPTYENDEILSPESEKHPATPEELEELQKILEEHKEERKIEEEIPEPKKPRMKKLTEKNTWLPKRIP
ncbi:MAG: HIT family protein [Nanoarchaeota archaeon]|nr:HIT family protein [Nanoarchaeota archaeon]